MAEENEEIDLGKMIEKSVEKLDKDKYSKKEIAMVKQAMREVIFESKLPYQAMGLKESNLNNIYLYAYNVFKGGKYDEAISAFFVLSMLDPTSAKYSFALASAYHKNKDYELAAGKYFGAAYLDPTNPVPYFHASDCFEKMGEKESAILALNGAISRCGEDPHWESVKGRALAMREYLKKNSNWDKVVAEIIKEDQEDSK